MNRRSTAFLVNTALSGTLGFTAATFLASGEPEAPAPAATVESRASGTPAGPPAPARTSAADRGPQATPEAKGPVVLPDSSVSVVYRPASLTSPSERGTQAAREVLAWLDGEGEGCARALAIYDEIEPVEDVGGEYPSMRWFCRYVTAAPDAQARMLEDRTAARFVEMFSREDWRSFRSYVKRKYALTASGTAADADFLWTDEFVRFNSPGRAAWERSADVIALIDPRPGMAIADIGAGPGYYSFPLAEAVGPTGKVYAVEISALDLEYMRAIQKKEGLANLEVVEGSTTTVGIGPGSVDVIFLCSTYQTIYMELREADRRAWIQSMKDALRPGGRVIVSENTPDGELKDGTPPYWGIGLSKALVSGQLQAYGLRLVREAQFVPQRYLLVLEKAAA